MIGLSRLVVSHEQIVADVEAWAQHEPVYQVVKTEGKSHDQVFTVACRIENLDITTEGKGSSRKKAEQMAASLALKQAQH